LKTDEVTELSQFIQSFQQHHGPGVYSASKRNKYQKMLLGSKEQLAQKADNLTTICEVIL
jgi:hypothetical protein